MEPIPQRAPLLFAQLLFPGEAAAVVPVEAGLLFCFPSTWKKNKTGLMKNTHGKCFITSSASPTALWHGFVIGRTSPSGRLAPSLSGGRVGRSEADTLSFPVRSFWRNLLLFPPGHNSPPPPLRPQLSTGRMPYSTVVLTSKHRVWPRAGVGGGGRRGACGNSGHQTQSTCNF